MVGGFNVFRVEQKPNYSFPVNNPHAGMSLTSKRMLD